MFMVEKRLQLLPSCSNKLLERKEQNFGVTQEFLNVDLKQILVRTTHVGGACPVSKKQPEFMAKCQ